MKKLNVILIVLITGLVLPIMTNAQNSVKKELKLKMVREENGIKTVIDTTIELSDGMSAKDIQLVQDLLNNEDFKSIGIDLHKLDEMDNVYFFDTDDADNLGVYVMSQDVEEDENGNKRVELMITTGDDEIDGNVFSISSGGDGSAYFFSSDGDSTIVCKDGENKIIIKKVGSEEGSSTFTITDELQWTDTGSSSVEVISTDEGKIIKVTKEDGTIQEYQVDEEGTYVIDENGEIKKVDDDVDFEWQDDGENLIWVHVDDDGENSNIVVKRFGDDASEIEIDNAEKQIIVSEEVDTEDGEVQVFVKTYESKVGDERVIVQSKVIVKKLNEKDKENLEKSGINMDENPELLEIDQLSFSPNPTSGKFNLEFKTPDTGVTNVNIYDSNGKEVYAETLANYDGHYKNEIDISKEESGIYFLRIVQGEKASTRKIILE